MCDCRIVSHSTVGLRESFFVQHVMCFLSAAVLAVYSQTVCWHPVERTVCSSRQLIWIFWLYSHFSHYLHPIGYKTTFLLSILVLGNHHFLVLVYLFDIIFIEKSVCVVLCYFVVLTILVFLRASQVVSSAGLCLCFSVWVCFLVSLLCVVCVCVLSVWRFLSLFSVSPKNKNAS